ncbi:serine hydrolase domain-containing protein [Microcella humidisoli]|uniref:Beta-lactamase family protein n=1 Tax=Microcella humidisoli TaxID=2963406 RepID=A0ABY5FZH8_9MICO|nr:serine hydrolase domain-containing protein [Microcella humidisoli]UTT63260.1 beta-lactamase family protein [Microcella humidisoli]
MATREQRIHRLIEKSAADRRTGEVLWRVVSPDGLDVVHGDLDRPFFVASVSKLFTVVCLAQLRDEGKLDWDAPIAGYLPDLDLTGLAVDNGRDVSDEITVREVLGHTAGLADYFEGPRPDGPTTLKRALQSDFGWGEAEVVEWTRAMTPARRGRGLYSDTGFQLLDGVVERLDGRAFAESVRARITAPLGLDHTYVFTSDTLDRFDEMAVIRYADRDLRLPLLLASCGGQGAVVSTLRDGVAFVQAFFDGRLFDKKLLDEMLINWHRIFSPLEYGTGVMRFRLPAVLTGFRSFEFQGHSGASGVVFYRDDRTGVIVVGTVNQLKQRQLPYQLMIRTAAAAAS